MGLLPQYEQKERLKAAFRAAFPCTIPIFMGFWFLGLAYGVYMHVSGFSFVYPMLMSAVIFGGSLEFVAVTLLLSPFAPFQALLVTLMIQARHLFYGLAMLDRFRGLGWKRWYLIFGLCDESFSLNYSAKIPASVNRSWVPARVQRQGGLSALRDPLRTVSPVPRSAKYDCHYLRN